MTSNDIIKITMTEACIECKQYTISNLKDDEDVGRLNFYFCKCKKVYFNIDDNTVVNCDFCNNICSDVSNGRVAFCAECGDDKKSEELFYKIYKSEKYITSEMLNDFDIIDTHNLQHILKFKCDFCKRIVDDIRSSSIACCECGEHMCDNCVTYSSCVNTPHCPECNHYLDSLKRCGNCEICFENSVGNNNNDDNDNDES